MGVQHDSIREAGETTTDAGEMRLRSAIGSTGAGGVARIDEDKRDARSAGVAGDPPPQVVETPGVMLSALPDALQIFQGNGPSGVLCSVHPFPGDTMVFLPGEALLLPAALRHPTAAGACHGDDADR